MAACNLNTSDIEIMISASDLIGPLYYIIYRRLNGSIRILHACAEPVGLYL